MTESCGDCLEVIGSREMTVPGSKWKSQAGVWQLLGFRNDSVRQ